MRTIFFFLFLPILLFSQNVDNDEYLRQLDANILGTIDMLTAFNEAAQNVEVDIKGWSIYSTLLMEFTLECSNLRKLIASADTLHSKQTEKLITTLISNLKPDVDDEIIPEDSENNLEETIRYFKEKQNSLRIKIIKTENRIIQNKTFSKLYLSLHSENFIYSLLLDFLEPAAKLSVKNRKFLINVAENIKNEFIIHRQN